MRINLFQCAGNCYVLASSLLLVPVGAERAYGPLVPIGEFESNHLPPQESHRIVTGLIRDHYFCMDLEDGERLGLTKLLNITAS